MTDPRTANLAKILVNYSTKVKQGDLVGVYAEPASTPLVQEVFREVLHAGGHPYLFPWASMYLPGYDGVNSLFLNEASQEQLLHEDVIARKVMAEFDVGISIYSTDNTKSLSGVDPNRVQTRYRSMTEYLKIYRQRSADKSYRWVITMFPTNAYAQDAEMSLSEYEDFVYAATFADQADPVAEWQKFHDFQQRLIDWLHGKQELTLKGSNIDLQLSIVGRDFINADGEHNMPSGEIYTSPIEDSANGWVRFSYPAVFRGRECEGVELTLKNGKVVKATAEKGEEYLNTILDTDEGARYLGEFAFGTNNGIQRFTRNILFDEKIGGSIHMAVGSGFAEIGGQNTSAVHWDFICDMRDGGQAFVDGELFYEGGEFKV
jgi:aminopeptidase